MLNESKGKPQAKILRRIIATALVLVTILGLLPVGIGEETDSPFVTAYAASSGTCGSNLTWTLDSSGALTISGTGAMTNWDYSAAVP